MQRPQPVMAFWIVVVLIGLIATACQAETTLQLDPASSTSDSAGATDATNGTDTSTSTESTGSSSSAMSAADVFDAIDESIVFISTEGAIGTGVVIDDEWILTNAHVVERSAEVWVGRSDGADLGPYPVYSVDLVFDLALIGPINEPSLRPIERRTTADVRIGDDVFLLGFPDEVNVTATPTFTSGIVSRRRFTEIAAVPFLQVDATIAPGQSGGALVDQQGRLIGLSGLEFGEGEFGLVYEADHMWGRVDGLLLGPSEQIPTTNMIFNFEDLVGPRRTTAVLLEVDESETADLVVIGDDDLYIDIQNLDGYTFGVFEEPEDVFVLDSVIGEESFFIDDLVEGGEEFDRSLPAGQYVAVVGTFGEAPGRVQISSNTGFRPFRDTEEGKDLSRNRVVEGVFDWPGDSDKWNLSLTEGEVVTVIAGGLADTIMTARFDGVPVDSRDDAWLGLYGWTAIVSFTAEQTGVYEIEIGSFDDARFGYMVEATVN